jgi:hypothetical protein
MSKLADDLLRNVITILLEDPGIRDFLQQEGLTGKQLRRLMIQQTTQPLKPVKYEMTVEYAKQMLSPNFDSGFVGDGLHCTHCYGNRTTADHPPHTYCAVQGDSIFCAEHLTDDRMKLIRKYEEGTYDLETQKEARDITRRGDAASYLKKQGYKGKDLKSMGTKKSLRIEPYKHNSTHWYSAETGVVVRVCIREDTTDTIYETVGIDRHNNGKIRLLRPSDVIVLGNTRVSIDRKSLNEQALEYLELN